MKKLFVIVFAGVTLTSCSDKKQQALVAAQAKQATLDSISVAQQQQKTIDSLNAVVAEQQANQQAAEQTVQTSQQSVATTQPEEKKKGWSNTAKGAVIGTGVGAVTGAIVSKHKGTGAVVGGLIGAGAGAGTGAIIDGKKKKDSINQ